MSVLSTGDVKEIKRDFNGEIIETKNISLFTCYKNLVLGEETCYEIQ
jgi:hypothetical protein